MAPVVHKNQSTKTTVPTRGLGVVTHTEQETDKLVEYALIRACARTNLTDHWCGRIRSLTRKNVEWPLVRRLGYIHGVLPLLYHSLSTCKSSLPEGWRDDIEQHTRVTQIHSAFLVQELGRLVDAFTAHGIRTLALKGPVLAQVAYGNVGLRRYVDLDVLIPAERFSEAQDLLHEIGYRGAQSKQKIQGWRKELHLALSGQWPFVCKNGPFVIDLHTRLMPPGYSLTADFEPFWARSKNVQIGDVEVRSFAPEDMLVILCFHGVKNQWRALKHVVDVAALIQSQPTLDWQSVIERAESTRASRILKLGLQLAYEVVEAPLPSVIQKWIDHAPMDDVAGSMMVYLRNRHKKAELTYGERVWLQLATKDAIADQLRYSGYSLMQHLWTGILEP